MRECGHGFCGAFEKRTEMEAKSFDDCFLFRSFRFGRRVAQSFPACCVRQADLLDFYSFCLKREKMRYIVIRTRNGA